MYNRYRVYVESMCFTDKLGMEFELPHSDKLADAVLTINKACSEKVVRRERAELDEFLAQKYVAVMQAESPTDKMRILKEIYNFNRK